MKYRDPKTGKVFETIEAARAAYCEHFGCADCCKCPLNSDINGTDGGMDCREFAEAHPAEAARLMELEVVEDHVGDATEKVVPRICQVLGGKDSPLEVGEVFTIRGYPNRGDRYAVIHMDGKVHNYLTEPCQTTGTRLGNKIGSNALYWLIEHPDRIIRQPRFTQEEVADARSITRLIDGSTAAEIERTEDGALRLMIPLSVIGKKVVDLDCTIFPSLSPGQSVRLEDVLKGGESHG